MTMLYFFKPFKNDFIYKFVKKKHEFVCDYLAPILDAELANYKDNSDIVAKQPFDKNIWILWWQGIENAPDLVKMCYASVRKNAKDAKVNLITKCNLEKYISIPDFIKEKFENKSMSMPFFSDYIRTCLLEKYGGLWLDATVYVSEKIPEQCFTQPFFTLHTKEVKTPFISNNRIHCYVLGGKKGFSLFKYMKNSVESYWNLNSTQIDYYLIDYIIMYGYWHDIKIKEAIDNLEYTSESLYQLVRILNKKYSKETIDQLLSENHFSKLNWRKRCNTSIHGQLTNFGYLQERNNR